MTVELITEQEGQKIMHNTEFNMTEKSGGVSIQQDDNEHPLVRMDDQGFKLFNTLGAVIAQMTRDGFEYFNNAGIKIAAVGMSGFEYFNGSGTKIAAVGANGFEFFDNNGVIRASISQSDTGKVRVLVYDESGKAIAIMGQDPSDGEPIIAVSDDQYDVEEILAE